MENNQAQSTVCETLEIFENMRKFVKNEVESMYLSQVAWNVHDPV